MEGTMKPRGKMMRAKGAWGRCSVQGHGQSSGCEVLDEIRCDLYGRAKDKIDAQREIESQLEEAMEIRG
jgi:hypothetical protein